MYNEVNKKRERKSGWIEIVGKAINYICVRVNYFVWHQIKIFHIHLYLRLICKELYFRFLCVMV
jgi:hypothetical protein